MDTMTNFTDDPAVLYRWRDEMADLIEKAPAGTFNRISSRTVHRVARGGSA
jgi:hypothetical protein